MNVTYSIHSVQAATKSTLGRARSYGASTVRLGLGTLGRVLPGLTADIAFRLAFRVRRFPRPDWEKAVLDQADEHFAIPWRDGQLAVWSWGNGPIVLLIHGWEGRGTQLGRFIEPLVSWGYQVVAFDGPGHGDTTVSRGSMPDQAAAAARVLEHVGPAHAVISHSMGAASAIYAASLGLQADRFVLIAPPVEVLDFFRTVAHQLGLPDPVLQKLIQRTEKELEVPIAQLNAAQNARTLEQPALIVHDRDDHEVPVDNGVMLSEILPHAQLMLTEGLGHRQVLSDPRIIQGVVEFIDAK